MYLSMGHKNSCFGTWSWRVIKLFLRLQSNIRKQRHNRTKYFVDLVGNMKNVAKQKSWLSPFRLSELQSWMSQPCLSFYGVIKNVCKVGHMFIFLFQLLFQVTWFCYVTILWITYSSVLLVLRDLFFELVVIMRRSWHGDSMTHRRKVLESC